MRAIVTIIKKNLPTTRNANLNSDQSSYSATDPRHRVAASNIEIKRAVSSEINGDWWSNYPNVRLEVNEGVVVLRGNVPNRKDIGMIVERINDIQGLSDVHTELEIQNQ